MPRVLIRRWHGRGLVVLGAAVHGWDGPPPTVGEMALVLELEAAVRQVRGLQVPYAEVERAEQRARRYRRWVSLYPDAPPVSWEDAAWVVVLHEPTTPELCAALAAFARAARRVEARGEGSPRG